MNIFEILKIIEDILELWAAWEQWQADLEDPADPEPSPPPAEHDEPYLKARRVSFDFGNIVHALPGSDNFPMAQAAPGIHYAAWGDGFGVSGTQKAECGISLIRGEFGNPTWRDVARFGGKCYGLRVVDDRLLAWVGRRDRNVGGSTWDACKQTWLYEFKIKPDYSIKLVRRTHMWNWTDKLVLPAFCQYPYGYADDEWILSYAAYPTKGKWEIWETDPLPARDRFGIPDNMGIVWLFKVRKADVHNRAAYLWYAGDYRKGNERWSTERNRRPCIAPNKVFVLSVGRIPGRHLYVFASMYSGHNNNNLQLYQAPEPWGPWELLGHYPGWGRKHGLPGSIFYWNFAPGWWRDEKPYCRHGVMVFTGTGSYDRFNALPVTIQ